MSSSQEKGRGGRQDWLGRGPRKLDLVIFSLLILEGGGSSPHQVNVSATSRPSQLKQLEAEREDNARGLLPGHTWLGSKRSLTRGLDPGYESWLGCVTLAKSHALSDSGFCHR